MPSPNQSFRVAPGIVREAFDDEIVIINLDSGTYYSLNGTGSTVWEALETGATIEELVAHVCERYDGEPAEIERHIRCLIDRLSVEQLVAQHETQRERLAPRPPATGRLPFAPPELAVFSDMQELLRLDPIHDVDATGWPHRPDPDPSRSA